MFTCVITYEVAPGKTEAFRDYARAWITLVEKYGGTHHGYFSPPLDHETALLPEAAFSFQGLGHPAPPNRGYALFSFPNRKAYETYRTKVGEDALCQQTTARFEEDPCFLRYDRSFSIPISCA
ncbi:MAG: NIPSNAP family protein [Alphaproteobacteria bacterium]|nr:NIPSNAP family protein [Alphaproteobacteria bacterium]